MGSLHAWDTSSSPFSSVLGTNHVPSPAELDQLKDLLVEPQHELKCLQSEISRLQSLLDDLLRKKDEVETYIKGHRILMSPIRRIPSETLGEIFIHCLPSDSYPFAVRDLKQAPLLMTTICRHWRCVAIDTPMLWSSLHIHLPPHLSEEMASRRTAGVNLWLERSATLPISISFHGSSIYTVDIFVDGVTQTNRQLRASKHMMSFMQSLQRFNHKLLRLHLCVSAPDLRTFLSFLQPPTSFPALISLKFGSYRVQLWSIHDIDPFLGLFSVSQMPALQILEFNHGPLNQGSFWLDAGSPTHNMSTSHCFPPSFLYSIAKQHQLLQNLRIGLCFTSEDDFILPTVTFTKLISLSLDLQVDFPVGQTMQMYDQTAKVLSVMDFPSLKSLSLRYTNMVFSTPRSPFHGMPLDNLETLGLDFPMTPEALTDCLLSGPNLTLLCFVDLGNHDQFTYTSTTLQDTHLFRLGLPADNPSSLCPKLRHIQLTAFTTSLPGDSESGSSIALADFLEAWVENKALDSFGLYFYRPAQSFQEWDSILLRKWTLFMITIL